MTPRSIRGAVVLGAAAIAIAACGCGGRGTGAAAGPAAPATVRAGDRPAAREKIVAGAMAVLRRLDDFDEARAYEQVFDRLSQWSRAAPPAAAGWKPPPILDRLPDRLREGWAEALDGATFAAEGDVAFVRDRRWLADIAVAARGDAAGELEVATNLFQWTVRSLAIVADPPMMPSPGNPGVRWLSPGEILLAGRASAAQRAWIFIELLRQAGIDGVMLATGDEAAGTLRPWLPAAIIDGEAHLFEPTYGMPVPGPGGKGVATARQAAADPAVLAALSVAERPYPVAAQDVAGLSVQIVADPRSLSRRMIDLDRDVAAAHGLRLTVETESTAARAAEALPGGGAAIGLWPFPWETAARRRAADVAQVTRRELAPLAIALLQPGEGGRGSRMLRPLFAARVREFRGEYDGPDGAKAAYLAARPSRDVVAAAVAGLPPEQAEAAGRLYGRMKEDATYWLGLVTLAEGQNEVATDYLGRMLLEATPDSRWADAARVNLAVAYVGLGRIEDAIGMLRADESPQRFGSRLRADRLERERSGP